MYEVEQKFPVRDADALLAQLTQRGTTLAAPFPQVDRYFTHPARDFKQTDEALRLRQQGAENRITYKGPRLDRTVKTRREIELDLPGGALCVEQWTQLLEALGFRPRAEVRKRRSQGELAHAGRTVVVSLDEVEGLGLFVELETLANETELTVARDTILDLAQQLGLTQPERRSYLQMLDARLLAAGDH